MSNIPAQPDPPPEPVRLERGLGLVQAAFFIWRALAGPPVAEVRV